MRYIQLNNDSFILYLSTGLKTITKKAFNYYKIQKLINKGADESQIIPLLQIPPLPEGTYEAYQINDEQMVYLHTAPNGVQTLKNIKTDGKVHLASEEFPQLDKQFVGVYASLDSLIEDWPEYLF
jgi:hypothetical protein